MPNPLKRTLIFLAVLAGVYFVGMFGVGAFAGAKAGFLAAEKAHGQRVDSAQFRQAAREAGVAAGTEAGVVSQPFVVAGAILLATLGAFGLRGVPLLVGVVAAGGAFLGIQKMGGENARQSGAGQIFPARGALSPLPVPVAPPVGSHRVLANPVSVSVRYGRTTLPRGTVVKVVSTGNYHADVQAGDGAVFSVPLSDLQ